MANTHLRLAGTDDLQLVSHQVYLKAAVEFVEGQTQRTLASRAHKLTLMRFPYGSNAITLPRGLCTAVAQITYYDGTNSAVTLTGPTSTPSGTDYQEDLSSPHGGRLRPAVGMSWPSVATEVIAPVVIEFTAGYTDLQLVPYSLQNAIYVAAAQYLDNPDGMEKDMNIDLPFTLLSPWRLSPL
jgi:uncharacterized phiE125 gp8 family phage protein